VVHQFLASFAALLDLLTAALDAMGLAGLMSDEVAPLLLIAGVPACAFLVAFSGTLWRNAVHLGTRTPIYVHLPLAAAGVALGLAGQWLAEQLAIVAAVNASVDDSYTVPTEVASAITFLWPLFWAGASGLVWALVRFSAWRELPIGRQVQSASAALALAFACSVPALLLGLVLAVETTPVSQSCCPRDYTFPARHGAALDVVMLLGFATVSLAFFAVALVAASRRARPAPR